MNKSFIASVAVIMALSVGSCTKNSKEETSANDTTITMTKDELAFRVATQDSLLSLLNDISSDMMQIKSMEYIVATPSAVNGESTSKRQQIKNDMAAISEALAQRRQRLEELEKKLNESGNKNTTLNKTIQSLKDQIAQNQEMINTLNEQLKAANIKIAELNTTVDSLHSTVATEKESREQAEQEAVSLTNELNTCYYALGSKKELQANNIIKTGFLRKTKIMQGDYELSYFTHADKRTLKQLPLHSKKAKVMTSQPSDSYRIDEAANGEKVLVITNPSRFWTASNFLVVQID